MAISSACWYVHLELEKLAERHAQKGPGVLRIYNGVSNAWSIDYCQSKIEELKPLVAFDLVDFLRMVEVIGKSGGKKDLIFRNGMSTISHAFWKSHIHMVDPSEHSLPFPVDLLVPQSRVRFQPAIVKMDAMPGDEEFDDLVRIVIERGMHLIEDMMELRDAMELKHEMEGVVSFQQARMAKALAR